MINLHHGQSEVYRSLFVDKTSRYATVNCSRGWGKSYLASTAGVTGVFELLELPKKVPNKTVYIVAPTHDQVVDIYYPILAYEMELDKYALKSSRDLGRFYFANDVQLRLISYESIERLRGKGAYLIVWDEPSSCYRGTDPSEAWESIMLPCIKTRWSGKRAELYGAKSPGRALIIGTPKGYNYFHKLCHNHEKDSDWSYFHYDYKTSPFLDPGEIERDRANMDPLKFASEYLALFKESGNAVFYCFDRKYKVRNDLPDFVAPTEDSRGEDVHVAIDFNVGLQCSTIFAKRGNQLHILDCLKGHPDTESLAISLATRFKGHKIYAYPDPSGRARKTSAPVGRTDFTILESHGITCLARKAAPAIVDSVAAVNRLLKNANGDINLFVHPRAEGAIESLEKTKWLDGKPDSATIDKSEGVEHFSDGIRYATEYLFPVLATGPRVTRGFSF